MPVFPYPIFGLALLTLPLSSAWAFCLNITNESDMEFVVQEVEFNVKVGSHLYKSKSNSSRLIPRQGVKHCAQVSSMPKGATNETPCQLTKLSISYFNKIGSKKTTTLDLKKTITQFKAGDNVTITFKGNSSDGVLEAQDSKGTFDKVSTN